MTQKKPSKLTDSKIVVKLYIEYIQFILFVLLYQSRNQESLSLEMNPEQGDEVNEDEENEHD